MVEPRSEPFEGWLFVAIREVRDAASDALGGIPSAEAFERLNRAVARYTALSFSTGA